MVNLTVMKFETILKHHSLQLPLTQLPKQDFKQYITKKLRQFLSLVEELENENLVLEGRRVNTLFIKTTQGIIVNGLIKSIEKYYDGFPSKAYSTLCRTLRNEIKDLREVLNFRKYQPQENFYRLRISKSNFPFTPLEMFHIPFELRGKVSSQRFSIPGFPSLYLGRTLYVCWEELSRPSLDEFQCLRLNLQKEISFLDLSPPPPHKLKLDWDSYKYFMTWPLIACCSVKSKNQNDIFKPEYIIPQLLLQWVRDTNEVEGIGYKSTHIPIELYNSEGELTNLVLPVKTSKVKGHCHVLKSLFKTSSVLSWQLYQYAMGGQFFIHSERDFEGTNKKLPKIELINGIKYPYGYSTLGKLEHYLDKIKTYKI